MENKEVTLGEIEAVLKKFPTSKSIGPNGWTIEFFLEFFDIMGSDILHAVEESKTSGKVY